jgi:hypothetical protein
MGLSRAASTLEHPIIFGFTCSVGLLLAASMRIPRQKFIVFACGLGTLISLSAGPIQGAVVGFCLLIYDRIMFGIPGRWAGLICLGIAGITAFYFSVSSPFSFIFNHLVFDAQNAWFRYWTWQVSTDALAQSPWFGLGFIFPEEYEIPYTVDSIWLLQALQFGIPGSILLALSIIGAASLPASGPRVHLTLAETKLGAILGILIFLILFVGFTVDFYGAAWILIPLLIGVRAHLGELGWVSAKAYRAAHSRLGRAEVIP